MCVRERVCVRVCTPADAKRRPQIPAAGVTRSYGLPGVGAGLNSESWKEKQALVTMAPGALGDTVSIYPKLASPA